MRNNLKKLELKNVFASFTFGVILQTYGAHRWSLACRFAMYHEKAHVGYSCGGVGPLASYRSQIDSRNWAPKNVRYCTMQMGILVYQNKTVRNTRTLGTPALPGHSREKTGTCLCYIHTYIHTTSFHLFSHLNNRLFFCNRYYHYLYRYAIIYASFHIGSSLKLLYTLCREIFWNSAFQNLNEFNQGAINIFG